MTTFDWRTVDFTTKEGQLLEEALLYRLYVTVDDWLQAKDYESVNSYLRDFEFEREPPLLQTGLLRFTAGWKQYLSNWSGAMERSYRYHVDGMGLSESDADRRFRGLR